MFQTRWAYLEDFGKLIPCGRDRVVDRLEDLGKEVWRVFARYGDNKRRCRPVLVDQVAENQRVCFCVFNSLLQSLRIVKTPVQECSRIEPPSR